MTVKTPHTNKAHS